MRRAFSPIEILIVAAIMVIILLIGAHLSLSSREGAALPGLESDENRVATSGISISTPTSSAATATEPTSIDTSTWKSFINSYGWGIKQPPDWGVGSLGDSNPEDANSAIFQSPYTCWGAGERCGTFQVTVTPERSASLSTTSPEDYLLEYNAPPARDMRLTTGSSVVDGQPAYEITYLVPGMDSEPSGVVIDEIAVSYENNMYDITYYEESRDNSMSDSPSDWKLAPIFRTMLSSFIFTTSTESWY